MTNVSFTNSSSITFTFNSADVEQIISALSANLDNDAMPGMSATDALLYDFNGASKTIQLSGKLSNTGSSRLSSGTATTIDDQRKWLELNVNGSQEGLVFNSNYSSSYDGLNWVASPVMISNIEWTEVTGDPSSLLFRITLAIGAI